MLLYNCLNKWNSIYLYFILEILMEIDKTSSDLEIDDSCSDLEIDDSSSDLEIDESFNSVEIDVGPPSSKRVRGQTTIITTKQVCALDNCKISDRGGNSYHYSRSRSSRKKCEGLCY